MGVRSLLRLTPHVQENVRLWGRECHKKGDKPGRCASRGKELQITQTVSRGPAHQTAGCASTDKIVYWFCSLNIFGYQLFEY
jgi:hypothetical protein